MASQADLVRRVLEELVELGTGESVDPNDNKKVIEQYASVHEDLERRHLVDWALTDDIPSGAIDAMVLLVAYRCARSFAKPAQLRMHVEGRAMLHDYRTTPWLPVPAQRVSYF